MTYNLSKLKKAYFQLLTIIFTFIAISILSGCGNGNSSNNWRTTTSSSAKSLTQYSINGNNGIISNQNISVTVPNGTDVNNLIAIFTTTGDVVTIGSTNQVSGVTPNNFTSPVTYMVTAADGTTQNYIVTVVVRQVVDILLLPLPTANMSDSLREYYDSFADAVYGTNISGFDNKIFGNNGLTNPALNGWINASGAQYSFGYNAPYVQTYSPGPMSFLSPLVVIQQCGNNSLYLVLQPVSNAMDTANSAAAQPGGTNVIIKYHSLYSNGLSPYPTPFTVNFTLESIDNISYNIPQLIDIHPHDGVWSPADNNTNLKNAFLDYTPHTIISQMDNSGQFVYAVNSLIDYNQLYSVLALLNGLGARNTLASFRASVATDPSLSVVLDSLNSYNQLVFTTCGYKLWY